MASIKQRSNGSWQAKVRRKGYPEQSRTFDRKTDAEAWARSVERDMDIGAFVSRREAENTTFGAAVDRYIRECVPKLRAQRQPTSMLTNLKERFGEYSLVAIQPAMLAAYREERLQVVKPQTVKHELGHITRVFKACQMDWGIPFPQGIPTAAIRKPKLPAGRTRRFQGDEEALLLAGINPLNAPWFKAAITLSVETAARKSELLSMAWADIDLESGVVKLRGMHGRETKNGRLYREVPLSERAVEVLKSLPKSVTGKVLPISASALDSAWKRLLRRCRREAIHGELGKRLQEQGIDSQLEIRALVYKKREPLQVTQLLLEEIERTNSKFLDLHWHDLRHEAVSRMASRMNTASVLAIVGQQSLKMLNRYNHPHIEDLVRELRRSNTSPLGGHH